MNWYRMGVAFVVAVVVASTAPSGLDAKLRGKPVPPPQVDPDLVWSGYQKPIDGPHLYGTTFDGSQFSQITSGFETEPVWSPDGQRIAFVAAGGIYSVRPDGSGRTLLHEIAGNLGFRLEDWSIATGLLHLVTIETDLEGRRCEVHYALDPATGTTQVIPGIGTRQLGDTDGREDEQADWSPDLDPATAGYQGQVALQRKTNTQDFTIVVVDVDVNAAGVLSAGEVRAVTPPDGISERHPAWSPDGAWLAYLRDVPDHPHGGGHGELYKIAVTPRSLQPPAAAGPEVLVQAAGLYPDPEQYIAPDWSPDGSHIAMMALYYIERPKRGSTWWQEVAVVRPDGSDYRPVTDVQIQGAWRGGPVWNPTFVAP